MTRVAPEVREAGTVLLLRAAEDAGPPEIFMLRRSAKSTFMPDALVFPGGRVDPEDGDDEARFERAARRECAEESGLSLEGKALQWFDTWKTPSAESPRRYVARFFSCELSSDEGHHAEADGHETEDGRWARASTHLDAWRAGSVDLPPPTLSVLLRLAEPEWRAWLDGSRPELSLPILPKVEALEGEVAVLLPHDDRYAQCAGDHAACPPRALHYPSRYLRRDGRWHPAP